MSTPELSIPSDPRTRLAVLPQLRHWIIWPVALGILTVVFGFAVKLVPGIAATELRVDRLLSRHHDATLNWVALAINSVLSLPRNPSFRDNLPRSRMQLKSGPPHTDP